MSRIVPGRLRAWVGVFLVAAVSACGDDDVMAPENPSIAGHWSGSAMLSTVRFEATFTHVGETVGGTGQFNSPYGSGPFTISGTVRGQDVDLILVSEEFGMTTYDGRFTGANTIEGDLRNPDISLKIERDD